MATFYSDQIAVERQNIPDLVKLYDSGKVHVKYFAVTFTGGGADGDEAELVKLAAGNNRVMKTASRVNCSAFGSSRVLDVGYRAHTKYTDSSAVNASQDTIADGLDISANASLAMGAGTNALGTDPTLLLQPSDRLTIVAKVTGGTIPDGATLKGWISYVQN